MDSASMNRGYSGIEDGETFQKSSKSEFTPGNNLTLINSVPFEIAYFTVLVIIKY